MSIFDEANRVASALLDHYRETLGEMREVGYWTYASRQLRPYFRAAVDQFSPKRRTVTERVVDKLQSFNPTKRMMTWILVALVAATTVHAQEARRRWEMQRQIRLDKFEQVLPVAMRAQNIDMWIVMVKENHEDPLWNDLGRGYVSGVGYYVFTDRGGDRVERAALGPSGYMIEESGAYDIFASPSTLAAFVAARNPRRIGVNMSDEIGPADGLSYTMHQQLKKTLGEPYAARLVSAERLVSEFRSRRVASEIVAFGEAAGIAIQVPLTKNLVLPVCANAADPRLAPEDRDGDHCPHQDHCKSGFANKHDPQRLNNCKTRIRSIRCSGLK